MHVECGIWFVDFRKVYLDYVFFESTPGRNIGVVIEMSEQDFIARMKLATNRTADSVGQRGHVGTEDNFVGIAVEEIGHGAAGFGKHGVGVAAGGGGAGRIGVVGVGVA